VGHVPGREGRRHSAGLRTETDAGLLLERCVTDDRLDNVLVSTQDATNAAERHALVELIFQAGRERPVSSMQPSIPSADLNSRHGPSVTRASDVDEGRVVVAVRAGAGAVERSLHGFNASDGKQIHLRCWMAQDTDRRLYFPRRLWRGVGPVSHVGQPSWTVATGAITYQHVAQQFHLSECHGQGRRGADGTTMAVWLSPRPVMTFSSLKKCAIPNNS
jgi:hypothetical protein